MRVKWVEYPNIPEAYWDIDFRPIAWHFIGEVIGTVRSWGTTSLVVMLDEGRIREVNASQVEKC